MSLAVIASALAIAPVSAHSPTIVNDICDDSGYEMTGVSLYDYGEGHLEFCLHRNDSGDVDITTAPGTGTITITLSNYTHLQDQGTWQDAANEIWVKDFWSCKTTLSDSGNTYSRRIERVRVQNSVFGVWDTIYDLQGPGSGLDYKYAFSPFGDTADRLLILVGSC
jgi:hypothetical protein